jgi:hypothetical protein
MSHVVRRMRQRSTRRAAATANNSISSAVCGGGRIRKFESEMGLPCAPSVMCPGCYSETTAGYWFLAERASKAKMQSMGADASFRFPPAAVWRSGQRGLLINPLNASTAAVCARRWVERDY